MTISADTLVPADAHMTGTKGAKAELVEWGDFQCPACGAEYPVLKQLENAYAGNPDFNFVFRNFPLPMHKNAIIAAEAAEAAAAQGKYWEMNHMLYEKQNEWGESGDPTTYFHAYAQQIGLDVAAFDSALSDHTYKTKVTDSYNQARNLNLDHTPTIFFNGVEQRDVSYNALKAAIDAALSK